MENDRTKLVELLKGFDSAVLVTRTGDGNLHGRPMTVAEVREDGTVFFTANVHSPKVVEIQQDSTVGVFFHDGGRWVSLSGVAVVVHDRSLIEELWSEKWKVWFPEGKEDPNICLIEVVPRVGEYWDQSGLQGAKFLFDALKAYVTGTPPKSNAGHNAKVDM